ncbi:gas vesicle protein GvpJ [Streptomyces sp. NPDC048219]|uniref:gas vesicle protein GvpJ n=1 Tax=unclassified Streptomyces TaxID=2593676 RepID=UPI003430D13C
MIAYDDEIVCAPRAGTLYDVLELILDRGMVIDVFVRVSLVGIEILKVDARIVVASVDTYLRFAEACNRLDLEHDVRSKTVPELFGGPVAKTVGRAAAKRGTRSLTDRVRGMLAPEEPEPAADEEELEERPARRAGPAAREREERAQRPRSRPAGRPRGDDDRPRSRPRRRTGTEEE